jgi:PAS domain S-box-containing protein
LKALSDAAELATIAAYSLLALVAALRGSRQGTEPARWAALTFATLSLATLEPYILPEHLGGVGGYLVERVTLGLVVAFPYCLYRFTASFGPPTPRFNRIAIGFTAALLVASALIPDFNEDSARMPAWMFAYLLLFLAQWTVLSVFATVRLWRGGAAHATLTRRRMRTMGLSAATLNLAILVAVAGSFGTPPGVDLAVQLIALVSGFGFFVGFAPPRWLRVAWRHPEQEALREGIGSLMSATTVEEVTGSLLPHVVALVGARSATITDEEGRVLASHEPKPREESRDAQFVSTLKEIPLHPPFGALVVETSRFTPYFGDDEIGLIQSLAALADLALERASLFALERQQRGALERANAELTGANSTLEDQARLLDLSSDGIMVLDLEGRIRYWNQGAAQLYGWRQEDAVGRPARELLHTEWPESFEAVKSEVVSTGRWEGELVDTRRNGSRLTVASRWAVQRDEGGEPAGFLQTTTDITERKAAEESLLSARREAERANQAKSGFLSRMSHELRTPLNAILGFAQLLEMDELDASQRDGVEHILKAGRHLLQLVNEVLDISRIESDKLPLSVEPVPLERTITEVVELITPLASERNITLSIDVDSRTHILADAQRFKQVMLNLLSNAVKYNRTGGSVSVWSERANDTQVRVSVRDTGPGIPQDKRRDLFTPFHRLGVEDADIEGTGLGLALSKRLVEALGGTLGLETAEGQGSTFWVRFSVTDSPRATSEDVLAPEHASEEEAHAGRTVLYIEDNLSNLQLVERMLEHRPKVRLLTAMQARLGLDLARRHSPDLVFLDLHLPDMNGEEALRQLRAEPELRGTEVVIVSADATESRIKRLLEAGADDYLTKPLDVTKFFEVLDHALSSPVSGRT